MNKKMIVAVITCTFLLIAGICYSCAYNKETPSVTIASFDEGQEQENVQEEEVANNNVDRSSALEIPLENAAKLSNESEQQETEIYGHICGAVVNPGVYRAEQGARIVDFIELAGGMTPDADGNYVNQAGLVIDGQRIYIPTKEEVDRLDLQEYFQGYRSLEDTGEAEGSSEKETQVNINKASAEELMELPGIGQAKADTIIEYRKQHGEFKSTEELMKIPGIKEGLFNQISSKVVVR